MNDRLLTYDEALAYLRIGGTKLRELRAAGEIQSIRIGRRTLWLKASLDRYVDRLSEAA